MVKGTEAAERTQNLLTRSFKIWNNYVPGELHELDGEVQGLWSTQEEWSRSVLFKFLAAQRNFPPYKNVRCGECYEAHPNDPFPVQPLLKEEEGIEAEAREEVVI